MDAKKSDKTRRLLSSLDLRGSPVVLVERMSFLCGNKNTYKVFSSAPAHHEGEEQTQLPVICEPYTDTDDSLDHFSDTESQSSENYVAALSPQQLAEIIGVPSVWSTAVPVYKRKADSSSSSDQAAKRNKTDDFETENSEVASLDQSQVSSTTNMSSPTPSVVVLTEVQDLNKTIIEIIESDSDDEEEVKVLSKSSNNLDSESRNTEILNYLVSQWRNQEAQCDVEFLACCGRSLRAHQCVVSLSSPKFEQILKTQSRMSMKKTSLEALREILSFMYTGKIDEQLDRKLITELLEAADEFEVRGLKTGLENFLIKSLNDDNAASTAKIARENDMKALKRAAREFLLKLLGLLRK